MYTVVFISIHFSWPKHEQVMSSGKHDDVNNSRNRLCSCFILQRRLMARNCTRPSATFCRQCSFEVRHQLGACMHDLLICAINRLLLTTVQLFVDLTQTSCLELARTVNGYFYTFPKLQKNMYRQTGGTHPALSPSRNRRVDHVRRLFWQNERERWW